MKPNRLRLEYYRWFQSRRVLRTARLTDGQLDFIYGLSGRSVFELRSALSRDLAP
jgi:hypothetical protein